jgi:hypothetical protein
MSNELTLEGSYWVIGICCFIAVAVVGFLAFISPSVRAKMKILSGRASTRLKDLGTLIKNRWKWILGFC